MGHTCVVLNTGKSRKIKSDEYEPSKTAWITFESHAIRRHRYRFTRT